MARVVLIGNLAQLTGGVAEFDLSATSVKQLFQQLAELHPALERHLEDGAAVAIDGQIVQDALFEPIGPTSEVFVLPKIAGGQSEAGEGAGFVLVRDVAGDPDGADHRAGGVADQHPAGHGHHAAVGHGVERREERVLLRIVGEPTS
jgi:sulfur-carrier protein